MKFNELTNKILQEQYFGGSPYEQATGIKKHINITEEEDSEMIDALKGDIGELKPYGYGDKSGNPERQSQEDDIIEMFFDLTTLKKVGEYQGIIGKTHVYTVDDDDIKDAMGSYTMVAYCEDDLGDSAELFPLGKWYSVIIGKPIARAAGMSDNVPKLGDVILHDNPKDKDQGTFEVSDKEKRLADQIWPGFGTGEEYRVHDKIYDGPAKEMGANKRPGNKIGPVDPEGPGKLDIDKVRADVNWAKKRGLMG
jgi:hypothetical protein